MFCFRRQVTSQHSFTKHHFPHLPCNERPLHFVFIPVASCLYHANRLPAKGQGRALLSGHPTTKTRNSMTYPGASLGRSKGRSRGKEGKGGNSLHFFCILNKQVTTSRRRSSSGSKRRRRREGEPPAGHRHRNARGTRLIPILLQDREFD